jgi:hypothetical protein
MRVLNLPPQTIDDVARTVALHGRVYFSWLGIQGGDGALRLLSITVRSVPSSAKSRVLSYDDLIFSNEVIAGREAADRLVKRTVDYHAISSVSFDLAGDHTYPYGLPAGIEFGYGPPSVWPQYYVNWRLAGVDDLVQRLDLGRPLTSPDSAVPTFSEARQALGAVLYGTQLGQRMTIQLEPHLLVRLNRQVRIAKLDYGQGAITVEIEEGQPGSVAGHRLEVNYRLDRNAPEPEQDARRLEAPGPATFILDSRPAQLAALLVDPSGELYDEKEWIENAPSSAPYDYLESIAQSPTAATNAPKPSDVPAVVSSLQGAIERSRELEETASKIQQGRKEGLPRERVADFVEDYLTWYAESLALLPPDYHERFRGEYEGKFLPRIKGFLSAPTGVSPVYNPTLEGNPFNTYWQHSFESSFRPYIVNQRAILIEASKRTPAKHDSHAIELVERIARQLPRFIRQMRNRQRSRPPIAIEDEYDLQDWLHGLLVLFFDDVRSEEWVPTYAGGSARTDFLIKTERVFVEAKMTRPGLSERDLVDQLIVDFSRYSAHPDCSAIVAIIYDPDHRILNPAAVEGDLSGERDGRPIRVVVAQG